MDETPLELLKVISHSWFTFDVLDASAICFGQWDGNLVKLEMMSGIGIFLGCLDRAREKGQRGGRGRESEFIKRDSCEVFCWIDNYHLFLLFICRGDPSSDYSRNFCHPQERDDLPLRSVLGSDCHALPKRT